MNQPHPSSNGQRRSQRREGEIGSVTQLIAEVKDGDQQAAQAIWERYFQQLASLARRKLAGAPRRAADEEDAALSAFGSMLRGVEVGRFERLDDRDDLWQVLAMLTARKAINQRKREAAQKRGGGQVRGESAFGDVAAEGEGELAGIAAVVDSLPSSATLAEMEDELRRLFDLLDDDQRQMVLWRLEGYTNREIAQRLDRTNSWVERKFRLVRRQLPRQSTTADGGTDSSCR